MTKAVLTRLLPGYAARQGAFELLEIPPRRYLMVDGAGDPNVDPAYQAALEALYPLAYALKFAAKAQGRDYVVPPLEGLWWADDMAAFTAARDKRQWRWTMLSALPDWVDDAALEPAREAVAAKRSPAMLDAVRLDELDEGTCIQTLHVGAFDDEGPVLERMHAIEIPAAGMALHGRHHEIYLSDARRVPPERRRTILRQPVRPATP